MKPPLFVAVTALALSALWGCAHKAQEGVDSTTLPGQPIVAFPSSYDRKWTTTILSNPYAQVSGVDGSSFMLTVHPEMASKDLLAINHYGDMGVAGGIAAHAFQVVSSRRFKKDIEPVDIDAPALISKLKIVRFRYKSERAGTAPHLGLIAEDSPKILTGSHHDHVDITNEIALAILAEQQMHARMQVMEREVSRLSQKIDAEKQ